MSCYPEIRTGRNTDTCCHPIQVLPLTEEDLTLRTVGTSRTDPRWLSPKQGMGGPGGGQNPGLGSQLSNHHAGCREGQVCPLWTPPSPLSLGI